MDRSHDAGSIGLNDMSIPPHNTYGDSEINALTERQDSVNTSFISIEAGRTSINSDGSLDDDEPSTPHTPPPNNKVLRPTFGAGTVILLILAFYSTVMSGLWLAVAILQPRWGFSISTTRGLSPSNATTLAALISKTIELVSAAVFVACLGQILTRRAVARKTTGVTLAEITIRNWVIQPGTILTHFGTLLIAGQTLLGVLSLIALMATMLYTTASEALVSPKLKYGAWEDRELTVPVHSYYASFFYAGRRCNGDVELQSDVTDDKEDKTVVAWGQCLRSELGYISSRDYFTFNSVKPTGNELIRRSLGITHLHDNITLEATRTDLEYSDPVKLFRRWGRLVDNSTLSIPHPSVWEASQVASNGILQPADLSNTGGFSIKASVVSPTINTMCVEMNKDELIDLVYEASTSGEKESFDNWYNRKISEGFNATDVDEIFRWGSDYDRLRPVFRSYPQDYAAVYQSSVVNDGEPHDARYLLFGGLNNTSYTLCEMRSWLSTDCSTHLNVSGIRQPVMRAHCGDEQDSYRYQKHSLVAPSDDNVGCMLWPLMFDDWQEAVGIQRKPEDLFSPTVGDKALLKPELPPDSSTMAETLSVYALSTLTLSALGTPVRHTWDHGSEPPEYAKKSYLYDFNTTETFHAAVTSQEYTSGHIEKWQRLFYAVLVLTFGINLLCLVYLIIHFKLINDFTEPQNLFALAVHSPSCSEMTGSSIHGPEKRHLVVPWRISQSLDEGEYYFESVGK
ncbi:mcm2 3 5 family [Fusarium albosuccineum]|uniref:Mcm2 3 5 family n=1 Tax=Fusarium albosuccineum TaxID=1237068 RepID=A0A8H4KXW7_9HYPO|nr:mcm2 3 5 family [Fusarium albosuccineum]